MGVPFSKYNTLSLLEVRFRAVLNENGDETRSWGLAGS
jgi:hypothetical protein